MRWTPHATVACVIEKDGQFLLVEEEIAGRRILNQPAGHLEEGESLLAAARREALEETAWEVEPEALLGLYTYRSPQNGVTYHRYCFIARALHRREQPLDSPIIRTLWMTEQQINAERSRLRSPLVLQTVRDYRRGQRFPLSVIQEYPGDAS